MMPAGARVDLLASSEQLALHTVVALRRGDETDHAGVGVAPAGAMLS